MQQELFARAVGILLVLRSVNRVLADPVSLFNPDPGGPPMTAYSAGVRGVVFPVKNFPDSWLVTNGLTTYFLGCNASATATGPCDFTAPITLIEGSATFHVEITKSLVDGFTQ
jgi:hypothetical protein